jgi:putative ABC transport system permease protein
MRFVIAMTVRELRASWRRLLFFFVCVAIGVGAIITLRSIIQSVRLGLMSEARAIIAGDLLIQTNRPWSADVKSEIDARLQPPAVRAKSEAIETPTMVRPASGTTARMVELRGVQRDYPFYGTLKLQGDRRYSHDLLRGRGALVGPELLVQLDMRIGDQLLIAGQPFTVRGAIAQEPGRRVGGFSFGSRVLIDYDDLRATGLLAFGSRATYQIFVKMDADGVEPLRRELGDRYRDRFVGVRSYKTTEDNIGESFARAENFLSLVGFVIVVLGGIGVWSVTRVFVRQKIRSVAILKCLGASAAQVLSTYVLQVAVLGLAGSLLGVALAAATIAAIPKSYVASFGDFDYGVTASAVWQGLAIGLLVSLLFALVPLLEVRLIKPLLLLRGIDAAAMSPRAPGGRWTARLRAWLVDRDWVQVWTALLVTAALVVVASWQAASLKAGAIVSGGFVVVAIVLYAAAFVLVKAVMPLAATEWFPLRHAVVSLRRPGNQTRVILLSVGLGSFFVLGVRALQSNLVADVAQNFDRRGADMFLIDIQRDQVDGVRAVLEANRDGRDAPAQLIPVLRARVTAVRGREVNLETVADVRGRGLGREYVITYRDRLQPNERVLQGAFWQPAAAGTENEVSIEKIIQRAGHISIGDVMRFDVLGRTIEARVTSVREVEWGDSRAGGFMFVFRPGPFADAPHTFIGFLKGPDDATARARLQHALVAKYPNITAIDGREILARIGAIVDNVVFGISVVGAIAFLSGVLILIGAVAMTKFQRVYDAAILRTLGATTRMLGTMLALEYTALGLLAGLIGALGALALSWAVTRYLMEIDWRPAPVLLTAGVVLTMLLVAVIGVVASIDVLRRKPLATLRAE